MGLKSLLTRILPGEVVDEFRQLRALDRGPRRQWIRLAIGRLAGSRSSLRIPTPLPLQPLVVVLCYGNVYRSPMAEALLSSALDAEAPGRFSVSSAGLRAQDGRESPADAVAAAGERGIELSTHRATRLNCQVARAADVIVIMDRANEAILFSEFPGTTNKTVLLGAWDPRSDHLGVVIDDPYGQGLPAVRDCYDRIERSADALAKELARA